MIICAATSPAAIAPSRSSSALTAAVAGRSGVGERQAVVACSWLPGLLQVVTVSLVGAEPVHAAVCVSSALCSPAATLAPTSSASTMATIF